ncbi:hypothetical protein [Streptomyces sp. NPDC058739]|uniref:hypothetical protein n=1 Tax=Streptomyces sp. NPDC058739 TaxID=3346618 RepID=UPI0036751A43
MRAIERESAEAKVRAWPRVPVGFLERYCDRTGLPAHDWPFYETFGLFRLAVIAQQIHYRHHHGQTRNPAFRNLWLAVNYLDHRCRSVIRRSAGS